MLESFGSFPYGKVAPAGVKRTPSSSASCTVLLASQERVERDEITSFRVHCYFELPNLFSSVAKTRSNLGFKTFGVSPSIFGFFKVLKKLYVA